MFGRRATPAELQAWQRRLEGWRTPRQFGRVVRGMSRILHDHAIDQACSCYRDAFTALTCAERLSAEWVRLGDDPPDFELILKGRRRQYEAVEVQAPDRRRGDELKRDRQLPAEERLTLRHLGEDAWLSSAAALQQLEAAVRMKATRALPYPPATILAVYLNVGFVDDYAALETGLASAVAPGFPAFAEAWVLRTTGEIHVFTPDA